MDEPLCPSSGVFKREHCNAFLLRRILSQEGCNIMKDIFELDAEQKDDNETMKEYLLRVNKISESDYCDKLDYKSRERIDLGPSCFDITLWFKVLPMAGGKIANHDHANWLKEGTFEQSLKKIKDFRNNDLCHTNFYFSDTDCKQKIQGIRDILVNSWQLVKEKYGIDDATVEQKIRDLNRNIDTLEKEPINDLTLEEGEYLDLVKKHQGIVQDEGKKECKKTVDMMSYIVLDSKTRLRANDIFVEPDLKLLSSNESIKTTGLLAYAHQMKKRKDGLAQVILVEGNAGVGKTTFLQLLFSEWSSGNISIKELDHYEFIIAISLNRGDSSLSSLGGIIRSQLPETFKKFQDEKQLQDHLLSLKTLITVDGLEELDPQSLKLFEEILDKASENTCITIVCTTRPEKVEQYYKMVRDDMVTIHFKLNGVPESSMEDLLYLYHCKLGKKQKSEDLSSYFKRILPLIKDEWKLPRSLSQMSDMCATDPECVNSTTTTCELSNSLHELMKKSLVKRLSKHESPQHLEEGRPQKSVSKFMFTLCQEALDGFQHGNLTLNENATKNLKSCCENLELLPEEVLSAFLVAKNVRLNLAGSLENKIESNCWEEIVEAQDGDLTLRKCLGENWMKNRYPSLDLPEEERTDDSQRDFTLLTEWAFDNKRQQELFAGLYIRDLVTGGSESLAIESIKKDMMKCLNKHQVPFHNQKRIFDLTCKKLVNLYEKPILVVLGNLIAPEKFFESLAYRRILIMLIGLFYMAGNKINVSLVREVVQLMKRSGELDRDAWIGIFNSIYFDEVTSKLIDQQPGILEGTDNLAECNVANIYAYATWFREFCPERENMNPLMNLFEEPHFDELLVSVIRHHCIVKEDHLNYLFHHPELPLSKTHFDVSIAKLLTESKRGEYTGPLTPQMKIPETVRKLRVSVADAQSYVPLKHFLESNSNLTVLEVCVNVQIDPSCLSPLPKPKGSNPSLFIPDVTYKTFQKAVNIISSMRPNCIFQVFFPRCKVGQPRKAKLDSFFKKMRQGYAIVVNFPPFCDENQGNQGISFVKTDDHTHMDDSNDWKDWKDWL